MIHYASSCNRGAYHEAPSALRIQIYARRFKLSIDIFYIHANCPTRLGRYS